MDALDTNTFVRHFLFGNNLIGPRAAKLIAEYIKKHPDQIETWYLAGNCINADSFATLVDALVDSPSVANILLKRNPLGPDAVADLGRLIVHTPNLRTLDLDQTSLGDAGVAKLFQFLTEHHLSPIGLRNLYLNATGAGPATAKALGSYLASPNCTITSLYMSCNPIGSTESVADVAIAWRLTRDSSAWYASRSG
jgi:NLR family CARD domain-containing protein 3